MSGADEHRYVIEQLGYRDFGVWDTRNDQWVITGSQDDCEELATQLNHREQE